MKYAAFLLALAVIPGAAHGQDTGITTYPLPANVTFPEGVAYDPKTDSLFTGSAATGNVIRMTLKQKQPTDVATAVLPIEPFPALLGMKVDGSGRLWIAGGRTGAMAVVDSRSGALLKKFEVPAKGNSLINDVAVVGTTAYFTDSLTPTLWRVQAAGGTIGELEPWLQFAGTPLDTPRQARISTESRQLPTGAADRRADEQGTAVPHRHGGQEGHTDRHRRRIGRDWRRARPRPAAALRGAPGGAEIVTIEPSLPIIRPVAGQGSRGDRLLGVNTHQARVMRIRSAPSGVASDRGKPVARPG